MLVTFELWEQVSVLKNGVRWPVAWLGLGTSSRISSGPGDA